ncbi:MAG: SDR family NAD(P)-dependent oxidoreductase [Aquabacterium sp.]|nr:SDR family NAD(P)-dependent oxidoreductase [Aquabacterium sp.]
MSQKLLAKQRAVVTGASSGIGEAIARALAEAGASVIVNYHSHQESAVRIMNDIRERGGVAFAVEGDVSKPESCVRLFEAAQLQLDGVYKHSLTSRSSTTRFISSFTKRGEWLRSPATTPIVRRGLLRWPTRRGNPGSQRIVDPDIPPPPVHPGPEHTCSGNTQSTSGGLK